MLNWIRHLLTSQVSYPPAPADQVIYAIGDVHGQFELLTEVQAAIDADAATRPDQHRIEVYLGDYVDRGPQSREVLDNLIARVTGSSAGHTCVALKGNHEAVLVDFLEGRIALDAWTAFGGLTTLMSYGVVPDPHDEARVRKDFARKFSRAHLDFLRKAPSHVSFGEYLFVHAGLAPGVPIDRQTDSDLLWIRDEFLFHRGSFGSIVVHGHTAVEEAEFHPNRINIDTGAYATRHLTCLRIDEHGPQVLPLPAQGGSSP